MAPLRGSPLSLLCVGLLYGAASIVSGSKPRCFPPDFLFGTATAAFQVEGAWNESGREPSIWDDYCRSQPDLQCADVADDFFHRYRDDVALMDRMGLSSFRFSISWSRLMHSDGAQRMAPTPQGIAFYHALLDDLQSRGLTAIVTLYHFDLPSTLQTLNGWLNQSQVLGDVQRAAHVHQRRLRLGRRGSWRDGAVRHQHVRGRAQRAAFAREGGGAVP